MFDTRFLRLDWFKNRVKYIVFHCTITEHMFLMLQYIFLVIDFGVMSCKGIIY